MTCVPECRPPRGKACHCPLCHENFASLALFDRHQNVKYGRRPAVKCKRPEKLGLVLDTWSTWRTPENLATTTNRVSAMNTSRAVKNRGK